MRIPSPLSAVYRGSGGILTTGMTVAALVIAGITLGPIGIAGVVGVILLLAFGELWRRVNTLESEAGELEAAAEAGKAASQSLSDKADDIAALESENLELRQRTAGTVSSSEGLLAAIGVHLSVLSVVEKHRALREAAPDAPVTRARMDDEIEVAITANCGGNPELFVDESVVVISTDDDTEVSGVGTPYASAESEVFVDFDLDELLGPLAESVARDRDVVPTGYVLRLAGLSSNFESISDQELSEWKEALEQARMATHHAIGSAPPAPETTPTPLSPERNEEANGE